VRHESELLARGQSTWADFITSSQSYKPVIKHWLK
jgi:hypothetical protein